MKNRPSYDSRLPDTPLQRRRYAGYTRALGAIWARRLAQRLSLNRAQTIAALQATSSLMTKTALDRYTHEPVVATVADGIAAVVHRFVTDVTPFDQSVDEKTGGASLRAMYADPRFTQPIVAAFASLFRLETLPTDARQAA